MLSLVKNHFRIILLLVMLVFVGLIVWKKGQKEIVEIAHEVQPHTEVKEFDKSIEGEVVENKRNVQESPISTEITPSFLEKSEECKFYTTKNSALLIAKLGSDVRVSNITIDGTKTTFQLPFYPTSHTYFVERGDGKVLSLFSDLRLNSKVTRDQNTSEPVIVYLDEEIIFNSDKVIDVGMASDGSSFYIIQMSNNNLVELVIHNLDLEMAIKYDISYFYGYSGSHPFFSSRFTLTNDAVWFVPVDEDGEEQTHYLFPTNGARPFPVDAGFAWNKAPVFYSLDKTIILNSNTEKNNVSLQLFSLSSLLQESDEEGDSNDNALWGIELPGYVINSQSVTAHGSELLLEHEGIRIFDISSGKINFVLPNDRELQRERLNWGENLGRVIRAELSDIGLKLYREIGLESLNQCMLDGRDYKSCRSKLLKNNKLFRVVDKFKRTEQGISEFVNKSTIKEQELCSAGTFSTGKIKINNDSKFFYLSENSDTK